MSKIIPRNPNMSPASVPLQQAWVGVSLLYERRALFSERLKARSVDVTFALGSWIGILEPIRLWLQPEPPWAGILSLSVMFLIIFTQWLMIFRKGRFLGGWLYGVHRIAEDGLPVMDFSKLTPEVQRGSSIEIFFSRFSESALFRLNKGHPEYEERPRVQLAVPLALSLFIFSFAFERVFSQLSRVDYWIALLKERGVHVSGVQGNMWNGLRVQRLSWKGPIWQLEVNNLEIEFQTSDFLILVQGVLESRVDLNHLKVGGLRFIGSDLWTISQDLFSESKLFWLGSYLRVVNVAEISVDKLQLDTGDRLFLAEATQLRGLALDFSERAFSISDLKLSSKELLVQASQAFLKLEPFEVKSREFALKLGKELSSSVLVRDIDLQGTVNVAFSGEKGLSKRPVILVRGLDQKLEIESKGEDLVLSGRKLNLGHYLKTLPPVELIDSKVKFRLDSRITFESLLRMLEPSGEVMIGQKIYDLRKSAEVWGKRINEDHPFWPVAKAAWFFLIPRGQDRDSIGVTPLSESEQAEGKTWLHYFEGKGRNLQGLRGPEELVAQVFFDSSFFDVPVSRRGLIAQLSRHFHWKAWQPRWDVSQGIPSKPTDVSPFENDLVWAQAAHFQGKRDTAARTPSSVDSSEQGDIQSSLQTGLLSSYLKALPQLVAGDCQLWPRQLEAQIQQNWKTNLPLTEKSLRALIECASNPDEKQRLSINLERLKRLKR